MASRIPDTFPCLTSWMERKESAGPSSAIDSFISSGASIIYHMNHSGKVLGFHQVLLELFPCHTMCFKRSCEEQNHSVYTFWALHTRKHCSAIGFVFILLCLRNVKLCCSWFAPSRTIPIPLCWKRSNLSPQLLTYFCSLIDMYGAFVVLLGAFPGWEMFKLWAFPTLQILGTTPDWSVKTFWVWRIVSAIF